MLQQGLLDFIPLWAFFLATLGIVLLSIEVGFRLARARRAELEHEPSVASMVAASLGLLAFLLAFTFGLAASRFDVRRQVLLQEVNAIGTTYLRTAMIPEPHRTETRKLLREYVDARLEGIRSGRIDEAIRRSEELHGLLWAHAAALGEQSPNSIVVGLFIQSLNEVIDLHATRVMAVKRSRIPGVIWIALFAITALAMAEMGYQSGLAGGRRPLATPALALAFAAVMLLIGDLDRPGEGSIRVSQQSMEELRASMNAPLP